LKVVVSWKDLSHSGAENEVARTTYPQHDTAVDIEIGEIFHQCNEYGSDEFRLVFHFEYQLPGQAIVTSQMLNTCKASEDK